MKPLFSVGEEVILQSNMFPDLNGEAVVELVQIAHQSIRGCYCRYMYLLDRTHSDPSRSGSFHECALRKKQEPGGDLKEFMKSLDQPVSEVK